MGKSSKKQAGCNAVADLLIPGYPKGSDITIINALYNPPVRDDHGRIVDPDYVAILYRDNKTGVKKTHIEYNPLYTFYTIDPDKMQAPDYNMFFIEKDKVIPHTVPYPYLLKEIARATGREKEYDANREAGLSQENKKLHADPSVFMSDTNIEDYYRFLFGLNYTNNVFKLSKGFMDIETDIAYCNSQFPEPGEVPINAIAYCDEAHNTVYQLIYNDKRNPLVEKYKQYCENTDAMNELKQFVIDAVGGPKKAAKFGVDKFEYHIMFYDDELELIESMFDIVNTSAPDFIEFWNMAFDLNFIIARLDYLGVDAEDVICDSRIQETFLKYYVDERNKNNYEERGDFVSASTFCVWIDQMIEFASRRKGRGRYQSFKLDAIGEEVAGVRKLDYSHITNDIGALPYLDMKTFSFYNVMDVIVQKCIETVTQDLEYVFTKCLVNNTSYPKCHRQSTYLTNRFRKDFYEYGYIIGNNTNKWNEQPTTKFPGAMVGEPLHNAESVMVKINGKPSLLSNNVVDFDYSSLYPSIILENNIAPNTQIGKLIIEDPENPEKEFSTNEHPDMYSSDDEVARYSRGGEFLENLMSGNILEFGRRWLSLGSVYDVIDDIKEFYKYNAFTGKPTIIEENVGSGIYFVKDSMINVFEPCDENYMQQQALIFYSKLDINDKERLQKEIEKEALL